LLEQIGVDYTLVDVVVDETPRPGEAAESYVTRVATDKATSALQSLRMNTARVLAADTAVVLDGIPLGKPEDGTHALAMLESPSGRSHRVLTAIAVACQGNMATAINESRVRFRNTTATERVAYVATGEPMDKAGAYAIQGRAAVFIEHLEGSYSGVMGLPLFETAELLRGVGIDVAQPSSQSSTRIASRPS
jgi:septum formation protein